MKYKLQKIIIIIIIFLIAIPNISNANNEEETAMDELIKNQSEVLRNI